MVKIKLRMETLTEKKQKHSGQNQTRFAIASDARIKHKRKVLKGFILNRDIKSEIPICIRR